MSWSLTPHRLGSPACFRIPWSAAWRMIRLQAWSTLAALVSMRCMKLCTPMFTRTHSFRASSSTYRRKGAERPRISRLQALKGVASCLLLEKWDPFLVQVGDEDSAIPEEFDDLCVPGGGSAPQGVEPHLNREMRALCGQIIETKVGRGDGRLLVIQVTFTVFVGGTVLCLFGLPVLDEGEGFAFDRFRVPGLSDLIHVPQESLGGPQGPVVIARGEQPANVATEPEPPNRGLSEG